MKYYIAGLAALLPALVGAQSITPATINNCGSHGIVNAIHLEFSLGESFVSTIGNGNIVTQGLLQPITTSHVSLPVTGLQFTGIRVNQDKVQLNWKTIQEMNNLGFQVERRKENEAAFTSLDFVMSKAVDGNSSMPLQYVTVDMNNYSGISYYRLKQIDIDGNYSYSNICAVNGEAGNSITMKAWPVPSNGDINIKVEGIEKGVLQVFDITGKLVRQIPVINSLQEKISRLSPGTYIIRLAGEQGVVQKVVVQ